MEITVDRFSLYAAMLAAESEWVKLLKTKYGKQADDARYDERGTSDIELLAAWEHYNDMRERYEHASRHNPFR